MEINGTIFKILIQQEIIFGDGTRKMKGGFVIMHDGDYPKTVAFELFGDERLTMLSGLNTGMPVKVSFSAESREGKNGNYYTTLRCFNIMPMVASSAPATLNGNTPHAAAPNHIWNPAGGTPKPQDTQGIPYENDLPFDDDIPIF